MEKKLPPAFVISSEVDRAMQRGLPIVALESTVITHGLPYPDNLTLAEDMEAALRSLGVTPATIAVIEGRVHEGLQPAELHSLATGGESLLKISQRDFAPAIARLASGGTTVAGTLYAAHQAGIQVSATGGIGGVHYILDRKPSCASDVSADLPALASTPMVVVCAGAKAILDLRATLEYLETWGVPVLGYRSDDFPAFYARSSGYRLAVRVDAPEDVALLARTHWDLGLHSAVLVTVPPPEEYAMSPREVKRAVSQALTEASEAKISGQAVTPFLLDRLRQLTGGESLRANVGLLVNNAQVAGEIALAMHAR